MESDLTAFSVRKLGMMAVYYLRFMQGDTIALR